MRHLFQVLVLLPFKIILTPVIVLQVVYSGFRRYGDLHALVEDCYDYLNLNLDVATKMAQVATLGMYGVIFHVENTPDGTGLNIPIEEYENELEKAIQTGDKELEQALKDYLETRRLYEKAIKDYEERTEKGGKDRE